MAEDYSALKVSIITPLYNSERFIGETIKSVLKQTHQNWEHIIIDDCSTDSSYSIAQRYAQIDPRIKLLKNAVNAGVSESRNVGLVHSEGRYIAFIDSDDLWETDKLELQLELLCRENVSLAYSAYVRIDEQGNRINQVTVPAQVDFRKMLESNFIPLLTGIVRADLVRDNGLKFESFVKNDGREDYVFWLNLLKNEGLIAYGIDQTLARYRVRNTSISSSKVKSAYFQWIVYRRYLNMNIFESMKYMCYYTANGVRKIGSLKPQD